MRMPSRRPRTLKASFYLSQRRMEVFLMEASKASDQLAEILKLRKMPSRMQVKSREER